MRTVWSLLVCLLLPATMPGQVSSGSDGSDGALDFSGITQTTNVVIDMHSRTNGVYQYAYVCYRSNTFCGPIQGEMKTTSLFASAFAWQRWIWHSGVMRTLFGADRTS